MTQVLVWSPLEQVKFADLTPEDRLTSIAGYAKTLISLGPLGAMGTPEAYANAIGCDLEAHDYRVSFVPTKMTTDPNWPTSSCGLTVRSLLLHLGCSSPKLQPPYKAGSVMVVLEQSLREATAWSTTALPFSGCIIFYGPNVGSTSGQHVEIVTDWDDASKVSTSTAGGAMGGFWGGTEISTAVREFSIENGKVYATNVSSKRKRVVRGICDPSKLPWENPCRVPVVL